MSGLGIDITKIVEAYRTKALRFGAADFGLRMHMFYTSATSDSLPYDYAIELKPEGRGCCCPLGVLAAGAIVPMKDRDECRAQSVSSLVARALRLRPAYVHGFVNRVDGGKAYPSLSRGDHYAEDFGLGWLDAGQTLIAIRKAGVDGAEFPQLPG